MNNARTIIDAGRDVWVLVFLEDGSHLLSGGKEEIIRQWRIEDGREVEDRRLTASGHSQVTAIALSHDHNWILSGGWQSVTIWNRRTHQCAFATKEHSSWVNEIHVSPDSTRFATASADSSAIIWNISNGKPLFAPLRHNDNVWSARFSPDGNRVATAAQEGELRIYDAHNGQLLSSIAVALFPTSPIAWSSPQNIFALSSRYTIKHICVETATFLSEWTIYSQACPDKSDYGSIVLSENGRFIASFAGRSLTFWDASTRAQFGPIFDHPQAPRLYSMALSPCNNYVATGGYGGTITIYDLSDIVPIAHRVAQPPRAGCGADVQSQIEALRGVLRALESLVDGSRGSIARPPRVQITPLGIPDGTYRMKSKAGNLYLTRPQDGSRAVIARPLNERDIYQTWAVSLVDDAYSIMGGSDAWLTVGIGAALLTGQRGTSWTFEPRGDAYVIGNAADISAIQVEPEGRRDLVLPRNNSAYQRWVLEPVAN